MIIIYNNVTVWCDIKTVHYTIDIFDMDVDGGSIATNYSSLMQ